MLSVILVLWAIPAWGFSSRVDEAHPFAVSFDDTGVDVRDGKAAAEFRFVIPAKYYLYKDAFSVTMAGTEVQTRLELPIAERKYDPFQEEEVDIYHNEVIVRVEWTLGQQYDTSVALAGVLYYQGCSDKMCYRLMKQDFSLPILSVAGGGLPPAKKGAPGISDWLSGRNFSSLMQEGLAFTLLICFLAGFLTGFTPCVLPIIPLTLAFMGITQARGWVERLRRMLPFLIGMVLVNTVVSLVPMAVGSRVGAVYQSPIFLGFLVLFFAVMALWMLGVIRWTLPSGFLTRVQTFQPSGWVRSNLYAGATLGILAMPCVGPVQATLLVYVALSADWTRGAFAMLSYSLGLCVVFLLLSLVSQGVLSRFAAATVWVKRFLGVMLLLVSVFYAQALLGSIHAGSGQREDGIFLNDFDQAKKQAKAEGKPLLIDFYADWCVPCHEWSEKVFANKSIQEILRRDFVAVKINCTTNTNACDKAVTQFNVIGWPTLVFIGPDGHEIPDSRLVGYVMSVREFENYLKDMKQGSP